MGHVEMSDQIRVPRALPNGQTNAQPEPGLKHTPLRPNGPGRGTIRALGDAALRWGADSQSTESTPAPSQSSPRKGERFLA